MGSAKTLTLLSQEGCVLATCIDIVKISCDFYSLGDSNAALLIFSCLLSNTYCLSLTDIPLLALLLHWYEYQN